MLCTKEREREIEGKERGEKSQRERKRGGKCRMIQGK